MINQIGKGISANFFVDTLHRLITTSSARFSEFDPGDVILFQIKVFARNIKETMPANYFIKITAHPSFTQVRVIRQINRVH